MGSMGSMGSSGLTQEAGTTRNSPIVRRVSEFRVFQDDSADLRSPQI